MRARVSSLVRNLLHKEAVERELDDEVRTYQAMLRDEKIRGGSTPAEAQREAAIEFEGTEQVKEAVRDVRAGSLLESLWKDARFGARTLVRTPGFTAVAVLSLALGLGGNAAMFSLVYGVLIRPLPYPQSERLMRVTDYFPNGAVAGLQQLSRTLDIASYSEDSEFNLTGQGEAVRLAGSTVSARLFSILGARAELGRVFGRAEDQPGRDRVVIVSHSLWQSRFGRDPAIIGRSILIDGIGREVVGVMPPGFDFPSASAQIWVPTRLDPTQTEYWASAFRPLIARLRPGATVVAAQAEIRSLMPRIIAMFPYVMARTWNADVAVLPLQQDMTGDIRGKLLVLLSAVACVLLIACANVASLLLARAAVRRKEIALRASLGASRWRILRQLLTESIELALAGAALGVALAYGALSVLKSALPVDTPRIAGTGIDWRVLGFIAALAILTGLAFGLMPALSATRMDLAESIKAGGQRRTNTAAARLRSSLSAGQVAVAVMLVIGAGLLIKSLWMLAQVNPGFSAERLLTVRVSPNRSLCREPGACLAFYDELLRQARGITGVSDDAATNAVPLGADVPSVPVEAEGHPVIPAENVAPMFWAGAITPGYLRIMRIPLLAGRDFTEGDSASAGRVILVDAATARRFWPGENPIGKHIRLIWEQQWRTVVGLTADVHQYDLARTSRDGMHGTLYMPYAQASMGNEWRLPPPTMTLVLRTAADAGRVASDVHQLVAVLNPNVPVGEVRTMSAVVRASTSQPRSMMWLFVVFAGSALILAVIGTYGVVSYSAAQRTYEMGLRVALGATSASVFGLVLGQSLRIVLAGLAVGLVAAAALTRLLAKFLFGVTATDPGTFLAVSALLVAVAFLAGYFPARRASKVDPLIALRVD